MEKNRANFLIGNEKSLNEIYDISSKEVLNLYDNWIKWLLNQKNYSPNTISSYSYDYKYFINFVFNHLSASKVSLKDLQKLEFLSGDSIFGEILLNTFCISIFLVFTVGLDI